MMMQPWSRRELSFAKPTAARFANAARGAHMAGIINATGASMNQECTPTTHIAVSGVQSEEMVVNCQKYTVSYRDAERHTHSLEGIFVFGSTCTGIGERFAKGVSKGKGGVCESAWRVQGGEVGGWAHVFLGKGP
jgi:hypothetical protein